MHVFIIMGKTIFLMRKYTANKLAELRFSLCMDLPHNARKVRRFLVHQIRECGANIHWLITHPTGMRRRRRRYFKEE